ncbi:unnamed protein product [Ectocarpus sp. 12 AP-2014]
MVLLDSADSFFVELEQMFALCKQRGAGTVYTTLKKVEAGNKQQLKKGNTEIGAARKAAGPGGRREGWLARAKISNQKARKISVLASLDRPHHDGRPQHTTCRALCFPLFFTRRQHRPVCVRRRGSSVPGSIRGRKEGNACMYDSGGHQEARAKASGQWGGRGNRVPERQEAQRGHRGFERNMTPWAPG